VTLHHISEEWSPPPHCYENLKSCVGLILTNTSWSEIVFCYICVHCCILKKLSYNQESRRGFGGCIWLALLNVRLLLF